MNSLDRPGEGVLPRLGKVEGLEYITPSRALALRQCALREIYSSASSFCLLPSHPAAELGIVAHRLLEEAGRGILSGTHRAQVETKFDELAREADRKLRSRWVTRHLAPLKSSASQYEVLRIRAAKHAMHLSRGREARLPHRRARKHRSSGHELRVTTHEGFVRGRIDAVSHSESGPVIQDYKTGRVFSGRQGGRDLKREHEYQLKLYAAMYYLQESILPARLEVVPASGKPIEVPFTIPECLEMLEKDVARGRSLNSAIAQSQGDIGLLESKFANPAPKSCMFCCFRPWCQPYQRVMSVIQHQGRSWPADRLGRVREISELGNGKRMLKLDSGVRIRSVSSSQIRHPALARVKIGDCIAFYNARRTRSNDSFLEGMLTTFYLQ